MNTLNDQLVHILGVDHDWESLIRATAASRASSIRNSAAFDDLVLNVTGDLILQLDGQLSFSIAKAKESDDVLESLKKVLRTATWFRVSDYMKHMHDKRKSVQFSQFENDENFDVQEKQNHEFEMSQYETILIQELLKMSEEARVLHKTQLSRRYRLASQMIPDRLAGKSLVELKQSYEVKSKATLQSILDDMGIALSRIAGQLQDSTLLYGTRKYQKAA